MWSESRQLIEDETAAKIAAWLRSEVATAVTSTFMAKVMDAIAGGIERGEWRQP